MTEQRHSPNEKQRERRLKKQSLQTDQVQHTPEKEGKTRQEARPKLFGDIAVDLRKALLGGLLAALVSIAGSEAVGQISGAQALPLVEAMLPSVRFLCISGMTASATILALMLTVLGISRQAPLRSSHYRRVRQLALLDTIAFVFSTLLMLGLTIPLEQPETLSLRWYGTAYYGILVSSSLLGGLLISVVLMIYGTIFDLVEVIGLERKDSPVLLPDEEKEKTDPKDESP